MSVRELVPPILRGETHVDLSPDDRASLAQIAVDARATGEAVWLRDECAARLRQSKPPAAAEYLLAAACVVNGERERAHQTLLALGEKLVTAGRWETLAAVADQALDVEESHAAARLLVKAHEQLGEEPARLAALTRAAEILPDDLDLGLLLAVRLGEAGRGDERRATLARLLPRFAEQGRREGLEEVALEFVEHTDVEGALTLVRTLPSVQGPHAVHEARQLLDIAFPVVVRAGRAGESLEALRQIVRHAVELQGPSAAEPFRNALVEAVRQGPGRDLPDVEAVLRTARLAEPGLEVVPALGLFDAVAALPPGRPVLHSGFGAGRIVANDGEVVIIDFSKSRGHRMPYAAAKRTLTVITDEDLRLLKSVDPAGLARLVAEQPSEVVWRALKALGGEGDAQKLKVFLIGSQIVSHGEWTSFWRKARAAAERDDRIDGSRAFEQHYRLAERGDAEANVPLPALEVRKPPRTNLATIRKFLSQHPDAEQALARRFGKYVARLALDDDADNLDRARAGLHFARWFPERVPEWSEALRVLWERGLSVSGVAAEDDQLTLLEASHAAGVESDAILSGLDSRFASVRSRSADLLEHLSPAGRDDLRRTMLRRATRYPGAALRLIEEELTGQAPIADPWRLFRAALALIEQTPKASVAERVLRWIEPGDRFDERLENTECPEDVRLEIRVLLRQWRSSDRYLFPAIDAVERFGLIEEAELVRETRQKSADKLFANVGRQAEDVQLNVMTRATWSRLKVELLRLERELRTTIPQAIQKARELGDLRENAEYHSAKLKQANVSKLVRSLQFRLTRARFVDEADVKDGIVGLGTEVVLESDNQDVVRYWILGEEEHHHGAHVVSFQAPVGRALMGRSIGDVIELGEADARRSYHIVSIERRLPPVEEESAS